MMRRLIWGVCGAMAWSVAACGDLAEGRGSGQVAFSAWGESYLENGIPSEAFEDGWSVRFDRFLIVFGPVTVGDGATEVTTIRPPRVLDLTRRGPQMLESFEDLEVKQWSRVGYQLGPMTADAELGPGVSEADKLALLETKAVIRVDGIATKGTQQKAFRWTFDRPTRFEGCRGPLGGKELDGVLVTRGGIDAVQLTIHGDHLFYDDLQSDDAKLRFQVLADADADLDGTITQAELAAVPLASIPTTMGTYGTGALPSVDTLADYVAALARTVGHFRGEGECFVRDPG